MSLWGSMCCSPEEDNEQKRQAKRNQEMENDLLEVRRLLDRGYKMEDIPGTEEYRKKKKK